MSSETFESLEDDFSLIKNGLNSKLDESLPKLVGQARKNLEREIQRELDELQRILDELEVEARRAPYPYRNQLNNRLKAYKQDLNTLKKKIAQSESNFSRSQLMATSNPQTSSYSGAVSNRGRLLQMSETIDRTTQSVNRTQQIAAQTDEVGIAVVDELGTQREALIRTKESYRRRLLQMSETIDRMTQSVNRTQQIASETVEVGIAVVDELEREALIRTKERLVDTDENLSRNRKILRFMHRRVMTNKLILIVIIILEIAFLCSIVYFKFFR
ncbi:hypothetical protein JTE90_008955 [Oedothorax gibbosus]|uniref:Vesicle transport v-SNARE N-terminal domain-containing protein n=1 Tax=Oedothorax gibbosus TaxID=931172 RepID=A0AAV6UW41_9ARAC|nr:hypothetical protein JTE90_008955 [Oedothorax gibbosus]